MINPPLGYSLAVVVVVLGAAAFSEAAPQSQTVVATVYKSPTCGCCTKWIEHVRAAGFRVEARDMDDVAPIKDKNGVPGDLWSCHTAIIDGYVVEGHVPADVIRKFLKARPKMTGLAVPGMPLGSPGMEGPRADHYDVLTFDRSGKSTVYAKR